MEKLQVIDKQGHSIKGAFMILNDGIEYLQYNGYIVANIDQNFKISIDEDWKGDENHLNIFINLTDDEIRDNISKNLITVANIFDLDL